MSNRERVCVGRPVSCRYARCAQVRPRRDTRRRNTGPRDAADSAAEFADGRIVFTSLHAPDAAGALVRMVEMGSDPFVVGDSTRLAMSQRLVRKLCPACRASAEAPQNLLDRAARLASSGSLDWDALAKNFKRAVGRQKCNGLGYKGRTVIAETLTVTPEIGAALRRSAGVEELTRTAVSQGMTTLAADGIRRAASGETTLEEVFGVLGLEG